MIVTKVTVYVLIIPQNFQKSSTTWSKTKSSHILRQNTVHYDSMIAFWEKKQTQFICTRMARILFHIKSISHFAISIDSESNKTVQSDGSGSDLRGFIF